MGLKVTAYYGEVKVSARKPGKATCLASVGRLGKHAACGFKARWTVTVSQWVSEGKARRFPSCATHAKVAQKDSCFCAVEGTR